MKSLNAKVALVTGGASGLGKAIAQRLAADGATVVITDVQLALGQATASSLGLTFLEQNVCSETRWTEVIQDIEARHGRLDTLINNAGIVGTLTAANPENTSLADWKKIFAVNVDSVFLGCRAAIPAMRRAGGGSIINISSIAGLLATPYATAYGASKATVRQLTKSVAQHCAQEKLNVRCNSVHPGDVRTPLRDKAAAEIARASGISVEESYAEQASSIPLGQMVLPEDVAAMVGFLASDESRFVTGSELIVDGGVIHCDTFWMNSKNRRRGFPTFRTVMD